MPVAGVAAPEGVILVDDCPMDDCENVRFKEIDEVSERSDSASDISPYERRVVMANEKLSCRRSACPHERKE